METTFKLLSLPITVPVFCAGFLVRAVITVAWYSMLFVVLSKDYTVRAFAKGLGDK